MLAFIIPLTFLGGAILGMAYRLRLGCLFSIINFLLTLDQRSNPALNEILKAGPAILKVVAIGPESTGKSTICEQLALHYNTINCPEYAREYLLKHGMDYSFDNLLTIAKGQLDLEERLNQTNGTDRSGSKGIRKALPLFIDTDMYVMKVWCEVVFEKCHPLDIGGDRQAAI